MKSFVELSKLLLDLPEVRGKYLLSEKIHWRIILASYVLMLVGGGAKIQPCSHALHLLNLLEHKEALQWFPLEAIPAENVALYTRRK